MSDLPIPVAVVSPNHLIRAGLISLIVQVEAQAVVTKAVALDVALGDHDVAICDFGAASADTYSESRRLIDDGSQVVGLVYDRNRDTVPVELDAAERVVTLSTTPGQLLRFSGALPRPARAERHEAAQERSSPA